MKSINPYLHFMGNASAAMKFYKSVFGGEFATFQRFGDIPGGEKMSEEDQAKLIHASLPIGGGNLIMATDSLESMGQTVVPGNNFHIVVHTDSEEETDILFAKLSNGGEIEMPLNRTFWGAYFGMCRDKFGIQWMINFDVPKTTKPIV
ncbi:MAG: VOC family protein [Cyclobacteriaceae bacterium]|jgi:PhnB protein|nr:VOC family protein [Cyclobacteriaceae bacterium]